MGTNTQDSSQDAQAAINQELNKKQYWQRFQKNVNAYRVVWNVLRFVLIWSCIITLFGVILNKNWLIVYIGFLWGIFVLIIITSITLLITDGIDSIYDIYYDSKETFFVGTFILISCILTIPDGIYNFPISFWLIALIQYNPKLITTLLILFSSSSLMYYKFFKNRARETYEGIINETEWLYHQYKTIYQTPENYKQLVKIYIEDKYNVVHLTLNNLLDFIYETIGEIGKWLHLPQVPPITPILISTTATVTTTFFIAPPPTSLDFKKMIQEIYVQYPSQDTIVLSYEIDSVKIEASHKVLLDDSLGEYLEKGFYNVEITGYADETRPKEATPFYNDSISIKRTEAVKNYLKEKYPIIKNKIQTFPKGEEKPTYKKNPSDAERRVCIILIRKEEFSFWD